MRSRRKTLRHEPLEERQLLAVDSGMAVVSGHVFAEDSSEKTAPYAVTILEDTALVEFGDSPDEEAIVYGPLPFEHYIMLFTPLKI